VAVGASRTYVGVHYPADVAGGLLLGRAVADAMSRDAG
jgi:membrane-associated phospholipid phosphatase